MKIETKFCIGHKVYFADKTNWGIICKHCGKAICFPTYVPIAVTIESVTIDRDGLTYMVNSDVYLDRQDINEERLFETAAKAIDGCAKLTEEETK